MLVYLGKDNQEKPNTLNHFHLLHPLNHYQGKLWLIITQFDDIQGKFALGKAAKGKITRFNTSLGLFCCVMYRS